MVSVDKTQTTLKRKIGQTVLQSYRDVVDLYDVCPNDNQPRMGSLEDPELRRQIEGNGGIFEPLLVEPHPNKRMKLRIIDGHRRGENSRILVADQKKTKFSQIPVEIIDRTLDEEERLRVWINIHQQRKEWDAKEKEMVAFRLVQIVGRASAASILGVTVRQLDKMCDVFELSERLTNLPDSKSAMTWSREIKSLSKKLLTPSVSDELVRRVNEQELTSSKDVRKLRTILKDPLAEDAFLTKKLSIDRCLGMTKSASSLGEAMSSGGLADDLKVMCERIKNQPWTEVIKLKSDKKLKLQIEEAQELLKQLKKSVSK